VPQPSPWQTNTFSTVFWIGRDCQTTAVTQAACSKAAVRRHQTTCRPDEFWTTVWRMWWRQMSGDGDWPQTLTCTHLRDTTGHPWWWLLCGHSISGDILTNKRTDKQMRRRHHVKPLIIAVGLYKSSYRDYSVFACCTKTNQICTDVYINIHWSFHFLD